MSVSEMRWSKEGKEGRGGGGLEEASAGGVNKRRGGREERAEKGMKRRDVYRNRWSQNKRR